MLSNSKPSTSSRLPKDNEDCPLSRTRSEDNWKSTQQDSFKPKLNEYINLLSGVAGQEDDGQPDHTYAKSSIWRPQNYYVKPCRYLFKRVPPKSVSECGVIDVEALDDEPPVLPLPLPLTQPVEEGDCVAEEDDGVCWADVISKVGWSPVQIRILPKVLNIIEDIRLIRLVSKGRNNEQFHFENALNCSSSKLSYLLTSVGWDKNVTQWLHSLLMKQLAPVEKEDYLAVLGLVKNKSPTQVDRMVMPVHSGRSVMVKDRPAEQLPYIVPVQSRLNDKVSEVLLDEKFTKLPHDPVFFLIPNSLECENTERFSAFVTQLRQMAYVHVLSYPAHEKATVQQGLDQMVAETRSRLVEVCTSFTGKPAIVIGWNLGAAIACLVAQLEPVRAVICLGYPYRTIDGNNQRPNLSTVEITCPVLFFIGEGADLASQEEMEDLRSQMRVPNQLAVVGGCNDQFIMCHKYRKHFCVTQSMVDRSLILEIYNFVGELLTQPPMPPPRPSQNASLQTVAITSYKKKLKDHQQLYSKPSMPLYVNGKRINSPPKRKLRVTPSQKLILINSAKYMSMIPHHNYAAKLQPMMTSSQGYQPSGRTK